MEIEKKVNSNLPWVEKYRPSKLQDLISHQFIVSTINKYIDEQQKLPNLLFYGPPGTGQTSTIIALAKQIYQKSFQGMVLELNASDQRGINVVREQIKTFVSTSAFGSSSASKISTKLVILDEADSMTGPAQAALRRIMEKYSNNARFCLICNYVSQVIPALQSRCTRFKFKTIPLEDASQRIKEICQIEKLAYSDDGIKAIFALSQGDMRRVVNMLQSFSLHLSNITIFDDKQKQFKITQDFVYKFTGQISPQDVNDVLELLLKQKNEIKLYEGLIELQKINGVSLQILIKQLNMKLVEVDLPSYMKMFLVKRLAEIEYRMSINCNDSIQTLSLIGAFMEATTLLQK